MTRLLIAGALICALPAAAAAEFEIERFKDSAAHPAIVLARRPGDEATLRISFLTGAVDDGDSSGLTRLAQNAILEANARGDADHLATALFAAHATLSVETGLRDCAFTLTAGKQDFERLATRVAEIVLAPRIRPNRFPRALERTLADVREPGRGGGFIHLLASTVVADYRYQNRPYGDPGQLKSIRQAQVEAHLAGPMSSANATVVVTGAFDRDVLLRTLRRFRGGVRRDVPRPVIQVPIRSRYSSEHEVHFLAYPLSLGSPRASAATRILAAFLEDRLLHRLRRLGIGYSVAVVPAHTPWIDLLLVAIPAHNPSAIDLSPHLDEATEHVRAGKLGEEAYARARSHVEQVLRRVDRSPLDLATELGGGIDWYGPAMVASLRAMKRQEFLEIAGPWLAPSNSIHIVFTPRGAGR